MLFSIITITRNNLKGLQRTCDSVKEQSFQGFEWHIIDGASNDGTIEFLKNMDASFASPSYFWHSEPDQGLYDAMNKGIEAAQGFYILFLNAGDCFADQYTLENITSYVQELQETPDFIYGDSWEERPHETPAYKPARPYQKAPQGMFTHHQSMIYRRDIIAALRYDLSYKIAADYKFTLQYLDQCKTFVYCPFALCHFESGGISQQQAHQGRTEQFQIRKELNIVSLWENYLITGRQKTIWLLRRYMPFAYWPLKSRKNF